MKLKKLEINGFKSFSEKASINFPAGISAVVGPNGCGKSNIVDALRWAMGEQSVKQLRGKSMEDVIFAGTDGKSPLNMAEVSLTLINDNGSAPEELKDCSEIMVTRRLFRSGESAYFLNKQPCRLKDIHNVFMGSGMGTKSYAVIQQGNIGAITEAGPEERRFFIEEAAGITRYKKRKDEAIGKVHDTNQNLLRVTDIITEINRQMGGLKRQAKKAELYQKNQSRIRELDIFTSFHYYDEFTRKIEETETLLKELKESDLEVSSQLSRLDAAVEEIKLQRAKKNQEISDQKSRKFEMQRDADKLENDIKYLREDSSRLTVEIEGLESAGRDIDEKNRKIETEIDEVEKQHLYYEEQIQNEKALLEEERISSQHIRDQLEVLNRDLESYKKDLMSLVAEEARYKNIFQHAANTKENIQRRVKQNDEEESLARRQVTELQNRESEATARVESLKNEIGHLEVRISDIQSRHREKGESLTGQVKLVQTLELERHQVKSRYAALKKMDDNFEWYKDGVKAIMKKEGRIEEADGGIQKPEKNGIRGMMADILEAESGFETAVEAVLGESLQYIIVKDQETGLGSIDYLQTHNAGRSGFIPMASVKAAGSVQDSGVDPSRLLLNHVSVNPEFKTIADAFLRHVFIADNLKDALSLWSRYQGLDSGSNMTFVTRAGDIISPNGIMVGGSRDKLSGILAKKQEIKELAHQIAEYEQKIGSAILIKNELESEARTLETDLQKGLEQKSIAAAEALEAEKELYKASGDLKHALRHLDIVKLEKEQLLGEAGDIDDQMSKYNAAMAKNEAELKSSQENVAKTTETIRAVSGELEAYNQKIVDINLNLTTLKARFENNDNNLKRLKEFHDDGIKRVEDIKTEIDQKIEKIKVIKERTTEYSQKLDGLYEEFKRLEELLESIEADYLAIDEKLKENDTMISSLQDKREKTIEKLRYLEIEQSQRQMQRENISNRIEEKYHHPLAHFRAELTEKDEPVEMSVDEMEEELVRLKEKIAMIGDVNMGAISEYEELEARHKFLTEQREDLLKAIEDLKTVIRKINKITQEKFIETFTAVNEKLKEVFPRLFEGGSARLVLTEPDNPLETGVEFMVHPPGKKLTRLSLLSGGEKALSAIAFIFSIFLIKPASFCLMDEIDAPLDDSNVYRFNDLVKIIGEKSQVVMITHNKRSMEFADILFGVTMEKKGVSQIVSVNLEKPQ